MGCVYEITFPDNSCYVGMTQQTLNHRLSEHRSKAKKFQATPIQKAVKRFGLEVKWASLVLNSDDTEFLCLLESELISYRRQNCLVLNVADGGYGTKGVKVSNQQKESTSRRLRGSNHFGAKMTEEVAVAILKGIASGLTRKHLAKLHNVSRSSVAHLCRNETWKYLDRSLFKAS